MDRRVLLATFISDLEGSPRERSPRCPAALHLAALVTAAALSVGCSAASPPESDASPSSGDGGSRDALAPPGEAASSDATKDGVSGATSDATFDATSDAKFDANLTSIEGGACAPVDGAEAQTVGHDGPDTSLQGCGDWLSASPSHAAIKSTLQFTAAGHDGGFGSVLDWNVTGGSGSGEFTNATATSATFTCLTPGPVVVTATDPGAPGCGGAGYNQATVAIRCDAFLGPWAAVSVGALSACGVTVDGSARCWGDASLDGVLGDGTTTPSTFPVQVTSLTSGVSSVSVGNDFACAVTSGGAVQCWGVMAPGLGLGSRVPVAVTGLSSGVTAVSSAGNSACALTASRSVLCWGNDSSGQLGDGTTNSTAVPVAVVGLTGNNTAAVSMGGAFACALSTTGEVQCWGDNSSGELGSGASTGARFSAFPVAVTGFPTSVTAVAAGGNFACALTSAGKVFCWGSNDRSQLGSLAATSSPTPVQVNGLPSDIRVIAAGQDFACALTSGGAVLCWGSNVYGALGNGSVPSFPLTPTSGVPVSVSGLTSGVAALSLGGTSACAVTSAGNLLCWGSNSAGQLGNPMTTFCSSTNPPNPCSPVPIPLEGTGQPAPVCGPMTIDAAAPDTASGWCLQQSAHTLCEDFDHGFPGQLSPQTSAGSMVREDDGDFQSSPRSLLATTSPTSPLNVESSAWGTYVSPTAGASFQLQADFKVGSDCFANVSRPVTLARVDYPDVSYTLAYSAAPATSGSGFVLQVGESEATPQTPGPLGPGVTGSSFVPTDQWARLTLSATLGAGGGTGSFGVTLLSGNAPTDGAGGGLFGPSKAPASAPVLRIGADAAAHGCTVHIDNVLFDVK